MKKTLVVVDMQNDFIDGSLGTKEARAIIPDVKAKIQEYRARGDQIIFTRDTHYSDYLQTQEGQNLPVEHCIENTRGWQIADEVDIPDCEHVNKNAFGSCELHKYIQGAEVELIGLCTGICVISNALVLKAFLPELKITVDAACCACVTPESHRNALEAMKLCQIHVTGA